MKTFFILLAAVFLLGSAARAQESMLPSVSPKRLEALIAAARENYPRYKIGAARVRAAEANVNRVKWSYADALSFSYFYNPNANVSTTIPVNPEQPAALGGYQIGLTLNGSVFQKPGQVRVARAEADVARAESEVAERNLEAEVKARYYAYVASQSILKARTQAVVDADNLLRDAKYKYEKAEGTFANYNEILITYNRLVVEKVEAEAALLTAKSSLEELIGKPLEDIN